MTVQNISKTHLLNYLQGNYKVICNNCMESLNAQKKKDKEKALIKKEQRKNEVRQNTEQYIKTYLTPGNTWDENIMPKERVRLITGQKGDVDYRVIAKYIKSMPYTDFLKTPYWVTISEYKKFKSNYKCAICGSGKSLATHHKSYERHGQEHEFSVINEDLIVLCESCHGKFHDKIASPS